MNYTGFQLGHPELTLAAISSKESTLCDFLWKTTQQVLSALALIILAFFVPLVYIAIKLNSRGPFLFWQERRGLNGTLFKVYKIRTMTVGSEKQTELGVTRNDSRVTSVGRILRKLKIDEIPQLWNIARGDMAFVGPRPIPVALDNELRDKIPGFETRYKIRPGLTSLGQICVQDNALGNALIHDWRLRFHGELHYIRHKSVGYDIIIISMTAFYVFKMLIHNKFN